MNILNTYGRNELKKKKHSTCHISPVKWNVYQNVIEPNVCETKNDTEGKNVACTFENDISNLVLNQRY